MGSNAKAKPRHANARQATPCQASNSLTFSKCLEWGKARQGKSMSRLPCQGQGMTCPRKARPRHANASQSVGKARLHAQRKPSQAKAKATQRNACKAKACPTQEKPKPRQGFAKASPKPRQAHKHTKCRMGSLAKFRGKVEWKRRGRDESKRRRAESQWIVAARPLCHLQYPVAYLSRLQRILPAARW